MADNTRDSPRRTDLPSHCATCGAPTETAEWHATETVVHDGDVQRILVFCDDRCKSAWKRQRP